MKAGRQWQKIVDRAEKLEREMDYAIRVEYGKRIVKKYGQDGLKEFDQSQLRKSEAAAFLAIAAVAAVPIGMITAEYLNNR